MAQKTFEYQTAAGRLSRSGQGSAYSLCDRLRPSGRTVHYEEHRAFFDLSIYHDSVDAWLEFRRQHEETSILTDDLLRSARSAMRKEGAQLMTRKRSGKFIPPDVSAGQNVYLMVICLSIPFAAWGVPSVSGIRQNIA